MTMPRKEQVKSINTRYAVFTVNVTPLTAYTSVTPGTINPFLITDTPGGTQESIKATVLGTTPEPYTIIAGDSINVGRDGLTPVLVTFAVTDISASKVAARINALIANTAVNELGRLRLSSVGVGATATVVLSDGVPGTLAKLGFTAGTYSGANAAVRGVVTKSLDFLGGYVKLRGQDGKSIMADNTGSRQYGLTGISQTRVAEIPGGTPVHGRLSFDDVNYYLGYFIKVPSKAQIITGDSRFDLLDATDSFQIIVDGTYTVSAIDFPTPTYTITQVVNRINERYATFLPSATPNALITGTVSQPYTASGSISISANGGADVVVPIAYTNATAATIAAAIQAAVSGTTCFSIASGTSRFIRILSNNVTNSSSIKITPTTSADQDVMDALGFVAGTYKGSAIAELYGLNSIRIFSSQRGSASSLAISGTAQTLTRMGLTAGTFTGSNASTEESIIFPSPPWAPSGVVSTVCLVPESLDFGEVPSGSESFVLEGLDIPDGAGQNLPSPTFEDFNLSKRYRGNVDSGKPVVLGPDGLIDPSLTRLATDPILTSLKKLTEGNPGVGSVTGLVANSITGTGSSGNPIAADNEMLLNVDPTAAFAASSRSLVVTFSRDTVNTQAFTFTHTTSLSDCAVPYFIGLNVSGAAFLNENFPLNFSDSNVKTALALEASNRVIPLSGSANGDTYIRVNEVIARPGIYTAPSLFRKANAQWVVTVGDGASSFGDFSGSNAIQQAIAFFNANVSASFDTLVIHAKTGSYNVNAGNGNISGPSLNRNLHIEGPTDAGSSNGASALITLTDGTSPMISIGDGDLILKNLCINSSSGSQGFIDVNGSVDLENVKIFETRIRVIVYQTTHNFKIQSCFIKTTVTGSGPLIQHYLPDSHNVEACLIRDTYMQTTTNFPILQVEADGAIGGIGTTEYIFENCELVCGQSTITTGNLTGNAGVLDLLPNSTNPTGANGVKIRNIRFSDCKVRSVFSATASVLLHVHTKTNADNTAGTLGRIYITRFEINGGSWLAYRASSTINPFTLIGIDEADYLNPPGEETGGIVIRNTIMGFVYDGSLTGVSHGSATSDIANEFGGTTVPTNARWGAFVIGARSIDMDGVKYVGGSQLSNSGDFVFRWDDCSLTDFDFKRYTTGGPGAYPPARVRFRPYSSDAQNLNVENWRFAGSAANIINGVAAGFLLPEPNSTGRSQAATSFMNFDKVKIQGFGAQIGSSIYLDGSLASGALYTSSPNHFRNITIQNFNISQFYLGIAYISSVDGNYISNFKLLHNSVSSCSGVGIWITASPTSQIPWDHILVDGNTSRNNTLEGIIVLSDVWEIGSDKSAVIIVNNTCQFNNASEIATQITSGYLGFGSVANQDPQGQIMNNFCGQGTGKIQCFQSDGAGNPAALDNGSPTTTNIRGLETFYLTNTITAFGLQYNVVERTYTDLSRCMHNSAILENTP